MLVPKGWEEIMNFRRIFVVAIAVSAVPTFVSAQQPKGLQPPSSSAAVGKLDSKTSGHGIRASKLIGMKLQNTAKENVGSVKDIVLNTSTGEVQYLAVTYGGFLGVGDKMFAVPMEAIKTQYDPNYPDQAMLILDVSKEQMNGAQGFDESHWPSFSDSNFTTDLYRRYKVERRWSRDSNRDGKVDVNVDRNGVKIKVDGDKK